ncbi:hypothetical protein OSB04_023908 [Centaurea solstitialis]|uniref:Integrase catalytic domain-containing protein n=1 Tax=Centaurea solstitialis TaxID=347529 RepID=A0AA38SYI1_9ASTR|nr:hypothetical protein OSB04_023908 [Centaurea solstitialis]
MYKANTLIEVMRANRRGDLYLICFEALKAKEEICLVSSVKKEEDGLWHTRFCHINFHNLDKLVRLKLFKGLPDIKFEKDHLCSACEMGKLRKSSHQTKSDPSYDKPLQMLHVDLCEPIFVQSLGGKKYILVLIDEFSRFTWVEFMRKKPQVPLVLINLLKRLQVLHDLQVRVLRSDNRTEFKNSVIEEYLASIATRTMLNASRLPLTFWAEAVSVACYTQNRSLVGTQDKFTEELKIQDEKSPSATITQDLECLFNKWYEDEPDPDRASANSAEAYPLQEASPLSTTMSGPSTTDTPTSVSTPSKVVPTTGISNPSQSETIPEPIPISSEATHVEPEETQASDHTS